MIKISGYTCVRNGEQLDYCYKLAIQSLLPVCDEVVVGYKRSTDNTLDELVQMALFEPKIRIVEQEWEDPKGDPTWWTRWINDTRQHLKYPVQLMLDADEVLDDLEACHAAVRRIAESGSCAWFDRLNFVKDGHHLIPHGHCCGERVARLGPRQYWMPSDEPHPEGEPEMRLNAVNDPALRIFHYGFIRRMGSFYHKVDEVNRIWFGSRETRLDFHRKTNAENWYEVTEWGGKLKYFPGSHPRIAREWLKERGRI